MSISQKKLLIRKAESELSNEFLIFQQPNNEFLYTKKELEEIFESVLGTTIPSNLSLVQKSHWVKKKCIALLGYRIPETLRSKDARKIKPKFINQLLDIFVQHSSNLQVWNYIPYSNIVIPAEWNETEARYKFSDCRYVIISHTASGQINKIMVKTGTELKSWDKTSTKTIKWQANILQKYRKAESGVTASESDPIFERSGNQCEDIENKLARIKELDIEKIPLIKKPIISEILFSIHELSILLKNLIGKEFSIPSSSQERIVGQTIEKMVVQMLGYTQFEQTDSGGYPDLLNQLMEVKFQYSGTIDLGKNFPTSDERIDESWNNEGISFSDIRYLICLVSKVEQKYRIDSIMIISGKDFNSYFSICEGQNFKIQMKIPDSN